jgi:hypothetical protein
MIRPLVGFTAGTLSGVYLAQNYELPDVVSVVQAVTDSLKDIEADFKKDR